MLSDECLDDDCESCDDPDCSCSCHEPEREGDEIFDAETESP